MKPERRREISLTMCELTAEEKKQGFHFCPDFDFDVVGPNDPEIEFCLCNKNALEDLSTKA